MVLRFFLLTCVFILLSCSEAEFNNPYDPDSPNYRNNITNYRTVKIGTQTWMAENLNYAVAGSKCGGEDEDGNLKDENTIYCEYSRLYNWATAMDLPDSCNLSTCVSQISEKHRGICPSGWHIPSSREWAVLIDYIATQECGCATTESYSCNIGCVIDYLKATDGWNSLVDGKEKQGAYWWATYENESFAYVWNIEWHLKDGWGFFGGLYDKEGFSSVRCLQDNSKDDMSSSLSGGSVTFDAMSFDMDIWFTGNPTDGACSVCGQLPNNGTVPNINQIWDPKTGGMLPINSVFPVSNTTVHGFGQRGTPIPPQRAGELILTAFPNASGTVNTINGTMSYTDWIRNEDMQKLFGLPPEQSDRGPYGIADPEIQAANGGYQFVKNGFPNESSVGSGQIAPTRCVADKSNPHEPRFNCPNFSMLAIQPFQITVTLYDQGGKIVTEYRETVTEMEFRSVVQLPNYVQEEDEDMLSNASSDCKVPNSSNYGLPSTLTTNGQIKVNVNIYPFSSDGKPLGNGVYIAKIDRVDFPYEGCINNEGMPIRIAENYRHYHADQKFEWMSR